MAERPLNMDGSVVEHGTKAAGSWFLGDSIDNFLVAFAAHIHHSSVLKAELWGVFHGLKVAWNRGFCRVKVFSNSLIVVKLLKDGCPLTHFQCTLVDNIHQIHHNSGLVEWTHVLKESNQVVDYLGKNDLTIIIVDLKIFNVAPNFILSYLLTEFALVC
jgi:ribonuclease HI